MIPMIVYIKRVMDRYAEDEITVYAAQASFFIVIASIPFIMIFLTVLQMVPGLGRSDLMAILVGILPDMLDSLVIGVVNDLYTKSPTTVLSITVIAALWSASRGMLSIERGLNRINRISKKRNYILRRMICTGYTIVFMVVSVMSLVILVLGNSIQELITKLLPFFEKTANYIISIRTLLALAIFILFFTGIYAILPMKKMKIAEQIPGAVFSTAGWLLFSYGFSIYFDHFNNFSYMYGSLTAIVLLMLWLYFCICILFIGAEINTVISEKPLRN